jgi:hypothetical protein
VNLLLEYERYRNQKTRDAFSDHDIQIILRLQLEEEEEEGGGGADSMNEVIEDSKPKLSMYN